MIKATKEIIDSVGDVSIILVALPVGFIMVMASYFGAVRWYRKCLHLLIELKAKQSPKSAPWLIDNHEITNKLAMSVRCFRQLPKE